MIYFYEISAPSDNCKILQIFKGLFDRETDGKRNAHSRQCVIKLFGGNWAGESINLIAYEKFPIVFKNRHSDSCVGVRAESYYVQLKGFSFLLKEFVIGHIAI